MNWPPLAFPTFFAPAGSKAGPPLEACARAAAAAGGAGAAAGDAVSPVAALKPQPVLPFWNDAPGPEQIPEGPAQQPLAQSALLRH
jgi:hypothetical protein